MSDALLFFQVMSMLAVDRPKCRVSAVIFHGRSFNGDDDGLFDLASLLTSTISENLVIINGGNGEGFVEGIRAWPGKKDYAKRLGAFGCNIVTSSSAPRTLEEGFAFSEIAEDMGVKRAIVIAQPFQLLRIMLTHLMVMKKRQYPMQIYAMAPSVVDWNKVTNGNQGQAGMVRFDQIKAEFERIAPYQAQGNLALIPELIEYLLKGRDAI